MALLTKLQTNHMIDAKNLIENNQSMFLMTKDLPGCEPLTEEQLNAVNAQTNEQYNDHAKEKIIPHLVQVLQDASTTRSRYTNLRHEREAAKPKDAPAAGEAN